MIARITKFYMIIIVLWFLLSFFVSGTKAMGDSRKDLILIKANSDLSISWKIAELKHKYTNPLEQMMIDIQQTIDMSLR